MEFLGSKSQKFTSEGRSALDLAGALVGCLEGGPGDLTTNPAIFGRLRELITKIIVSTAFLAPTTVYT